MTKAWWLAVPPVRSSPLCFWFFLRDEGTKMMMMPVLSGGLDSGSFFFCCYFGFLPLLMTVRSGARLINVYSFSVFPCSLCLRPGDEDNAGFCSLLLFLFSLSLPVSSVLPLSFFFCFGSCSPSPSLVQYVYLRASSVFFLPSQFSSPSVRLYFLSLSPVFFFCFGS
ncbi:hypothetical protein POPTR_016G022050v4 [Populus trichocarpa]|jgi:hypothetical protein|uniref:Transmembrane protein n=1 Tax=Populus trichocarpa TaxID=3694 RepID=A0A3N7H1P5_POPTR|nr:hypothetical protein BDE02_16G020500 [Populus trichocarpa]RQP01202.1 hypothetical protein POPTR_016G022050v4 [Populus trichocarpa]